MKKQESLTAMETALRVRNYSPRTRENYLFMVERFLTYCVTAGTGKTAIEYVNDFIILLQRTGKEASTINLYLAAIRFYFNEVRKAPITVNDVPNLKTPLKLPGVFSQDEIKHILTAPMNTKHRLFLMVVYGCGLRVGEAVKIKVRDVHVDRGLLCIRGKGDKDRIVSIVDIPGDLLSAQMHGKGQDEWLFEAQGTQNHICKRTASKILEHACKKAGICGQCNIHKLRHSFATHHLEQGTDVTYIQKMLGHNNVKTTMVYTHVSNAMITKIRSPLSKVL